jgi:hypothetical protein
VPEHINGHRKKERGCARRLVRVLLLAAGRRALRTANGQRRTAAWVCRRPWRERLWLSSRCTCLRLHVHSQIAHVARTATDGKCRSPDSLGYNEYIGAVAAIVSQHLEETLTRRFSLEWTARDDGHGFEIKGIG